MKETDGKKTEESVEAGWLQRSAIVEKRHVTYAKYADSQFCKLKKKKNKQKDREKASRHGRFESHADKRVQFHRISEFS